VCSLADVETEVKSQRSIKCVTFQAKSLPMVHVLHVSGPLYWVGRKDRHCSSHVLTLEDTASFFWLKVRARFPLGSPRSAATRGNTLAPNLWLCPHSELLEPFPAGQS
jgi:hypothetical protein